MFNEMYSNYGRYLRLLREKNGFTQVYVATEATLSVRHYQEIEYEKNSCRVDTLSKILNVYDLNLLSFFELFTYEIFYEVGFKEISKIFNTKKSFSCIINTDGLITEIQHNDEDLTSTKNHSIINNKFFWDLADSNIEKDFLEKIFHIVILAKPKPVPWEGYVRFHSEKKRKIKCLWRYLSHDITKPEHFIELFMFEPHRFEVANALIGHKWSSVEK